METDELEENTPRGYTKWLRISDGIWMRQRLWADLVMRIDVEKEDECCRNGNETVVDGRSQTEYRCVGSG